MQESRAPVCVRQAGGHCLCTAGRDTVASVCCGTAVQQGRLSNCISVMYRLLAGWLASS